MTEYLNPSISRGLSAVTDDHAIPNSRYDDQLGRVRLRAVDPAAICANSPTRVRPQSRDTRKRRSATKAAQRNHGEFQ
jgi:hypothetical protein